LSGLLIGFKFELAQVYTVKGGRIGVNLRAHLGPPVLLHLFGLFANGLSALLEMTTKFGRPVFEERIELDADTSARFREPCKIFPPSPVSLASRTLVSPPSTMHDRRALGRRIVICLV